MVNVHVAIRNVFIIAVVTTLIAVKPDPVHINFRTIPLIVGRPAEGTNLIRVGENLTTIACIRFGNCITIIIKDVRILSHDHLIAMTGRGR